MPRVSADKVEGTTIIVCTEWLSAIKKCMVQEKLLCISEISDIFFWCVYIHNDRIGSSHLNSQHM